jgi:hypothetical protein
MKVCPLCEKEYLESLSICDACNSWLVEADRQFPGNGERWRQLGTREDYIGFEKRKDPRVEIRFPIKVCFELLLSGYPEGLSHADTHDIGGGGVLFEADQYASVNTIIETHINLPGGHGVLRTLAKVLNVQRRRDLFITTAAFLRIDAVHRAKVNRFVEERYLINSGVTLSKTKSLT